MRLLALDQASRVSGYAIFENGQLIKSGTFTANDDDIGERLVKIRKKVLNIIKENNIDEVAFEDIQLQNQGNNAQTHKILAEVFGVIQELLAENNIKYTIVHSQTWKSTLGIKGKDRQAQKKNAQEYVLKNYGKNVSQDESDAICIGSHIFKKEDSPVFDWE